ncbi:hypothetical protein FD755_008817 [Muntiacus reevesi]|uniref:3'-phosphate/5'-hydroxy nucleic acid ligase n=1 Tax=Muntiacus reevesi TaxID=9886 RepID=A0A5J5MLA7_MUNRE|nr:hypothetical protein FD755_008817 [Muntiacus reevesi]
MSHCYNDELCFLEKINKNCWRIKKGFMPNMNACRGGGIGASLPAMKQIGTVALPGIVHQSVGFPNVHSSYGFAIGNKAAFNMNDPEAVVSPDGVRFDVNCGVCLLRTNLDESDVQPAKEQPVQAMFDHSPVGMGSKGVIPRRLWAWAEDKEHCEEYRRMLQADPNKLGTLGAGNHYIEIHVVNEIFSESVAKKMSISHKRQMCMMIKNALVAMEKAMKRDRIIVNDHQLICAQIVSPKGQDYLKAMAAAEKGNHCSSMAFLTCQAFAKVFNTTPDNLALHVIYAVSHNIAKVEQHVVDGKERTSLSQAKSRHSLDFQDGLDKLADVGIAIQATEFSTSVTDVVNTCHDPRVNKKAINLRPIAVIKG